MIRIYCDLCESQIDGEYAEFNYLKTSLLDKGRPKGKTIKERVRDWLEEHPEDMKGFVQHFVKKNKELAWQMLEGRPAQQLGSDPDNPLIVKIDIDTAKAFNIDESDT